MVESKDRVEMKFTIPVWLHNLLREEARRTHRTLADIARESLADRYRDRLFSADAAATSPAVRAARAAVSVEEVES